MADSPAEIAQRRRRVFELTPEGTVALKDWLSAPIGQVDVANRMNALMLKFAFIEDALGRRATLSFLRNFEFELKAYVAVLAKYTESDLTRMAMSARLALQSGLLGYRAQAEWLSYALQTYEER